ncbi:TonB-dependent receptor [Sunxiuqinia sp. A32]|uniref:TonB-dependent receptor n=1 Tax=Sunxiuqinia sp. A32 TaxID=3461496 RepID=UPI004045ABB3
MRNTLLIILSAVFQVFGSISYSQTAKLNLDMEHVAIKDVLSRIEDESGFYFLYNSELVDVEKKVSITVNNESIGKTLALLFKRSNINFSIKERHIILTPNESESSQQKKTVSGKVTDSSGVPLPGVAVVVKGTTTGTITDTDGMFSIPNVDVNAILRFSFVGMKTLEQVIRDQTVFDVILEEETVGVDEVVVVGYGTQKKVNLTGAVDQVGSEVFENRPLANTSQGLVGVIPNLNIRMLSGKPKESPSFNIRGTTSIGQGGSALVLIDGVEGNPRLLNPNDIESISVLKDAASASIYGARGAFGVVLITTKSAEEGKVSITYSTNASIKFPTTVPDNITGSYPWAKGFSDAWAAWFDNGRTPTAINVTMPFSQAYLDEVKRRWEDPSLPRIEVDPSTGEYQYYSSTDWYALLHKDQFFAQDHNISLSGGNEKATFYLSGRYNSQDGLFRYNSDDYEVYNLRSKGTIQVAPWFQIENNIDYSSSSYHLPLNAAFQGVDPWTLVNAAGFPLSPMLNPDGTLTFSGAYSVGDFYLGKNGSDEVSRFFKNKTSFKTDFFDESLTVQGDVTFQTTDARTRDKLVQIPYSRYEGVIAYAGQNTNQLTDQTATANYLATNIYANYKKSIKEIHNIGLLAGFNYEQSIYRHLGARRNGLVYEDAEDLNLALGESFLVRGGYQKWAIAGCFFRVNYDFKNRYLLELNGRYDGSSKFPTNEQWAFFPSASVGWRISEEPFWKVNRAAFSNVKLRASYGSLGNGNIAPYSFTDNFSISQSGRIINGIRPQQTLQPVVVPRGLTWETSTTGNIGLEFSSFNGKFQFTGDMYRRWTTNMFTAGPSLPAIFGTAVPKGNYADLETTGWEVTLNWRDKFNLGDEPFNYELRVTMSDYTAEITKYNNPDKNLTDYYVGQRLGEIWGYQVEGLFQSMEDIANSPSQTNIPSNGSRINYPGDLKFKDINGDEVIYSGLNRVGDSGDMTIIGNSQPRYNYSLNLNTDWNGFFLSAFFQGVLKQDWYPSGESRFWGQYNRPYNVFPSWQESNMFREELGNFDAYLPRLVGYTRLLGSMRYPNDRYLQNASYIRLRNLQVGYTLPESLSSRIGAKNIKVYLSGENLWTWSPMYKLTKDTDVTSIYGSDRDTSNGNWGDGSNYPMLTSISIGLNVNF